MDFVSGLLSPIDQKQARMKNPLLLAYIGDTIYDLYIRVDNVKNSNENINKLNRRVCGKVNAHAQSEAADKIYDILKDEEKDVYRRGRNAKSGTQPKNMDIVDYRKATGLEALLGYLFLIGDFDRLEELIGIIIK